MPDDVGETRCEADMARAMVRKGLFVSTNILIIVPFQKDGKKAAFKIDKKVRRYTYFVVLISGGYRPETGSRAV